MDGNDSFAKERWQRRQNAPKKDRLSMGALAYTRVRYLTGGDVSSQVRRFRKRQARRVLEVGQMSGWQKYTDRRSRSNNAAIAPDSCRRLGCGGLSDMQRGQCDDTDITLQCISDFNQGRVDWSRAATERISATN